MREITLKIEGPFSFIGGVENPYYLDSPACDLPGIYLWTVPQKNTELIYYVGETGKTFRERFFDHLKGYLSGDYGVNDPLKLMEGKRERIWDGYWRGGTVNEFVACYEKLYPKIIELLKLFRLYFIPIDCDVNLRKRIEREIAMGLYDRSGVVGNFQEEETKKSYQKRRIDDGPIKIKLDFSFKIEGLSKEFEIK